MGDFKTIETQEQFDEAVGEYIRNGGYLSPEDAQKKYEGYLSPEDAQKKYEGYLSPDDEKKKYKDYLSPEKAKEKDDAIRGYERKEKKVKIAMEAGLPFELADRIKGETDEDMKKDAGMIAGMIKKGNPYPTYSKDPENADSKKAAMKKMLENLKED